MQLLPSCCSAVVVLLVVAALVVVNGGKPAPSLPCTFSVEYREWQQYRSTLNNHLFTHFPHAATTTTTTKRTLSSSSSSSPSSSDDYDTTFMWYHVEGEALNQEGADNTTFIWEAPQTFTLISPFFDRFTCVRYESGSTPYPGCPTFPSDSKLARSNMDCPKEAGEWAVGLKCDNWEWTDQSYSTYEETYLLAGTNIPVYITIETEEMMMAEVWKGFNTSKPDASHFKPKKTQPCTDLTDDDDDEDEKDTTTTAAAAAAAAETTLVNSEENLKRINERIKDKQWTAKAQKRFEGMTLQQLSNTLLMPINLPHNKHSSESTAARPPATKIPEQFDSREAWPQCGTMRQIRDQAKCGSCWAFSTAEALSDRLCVANNNNMSLSPQYLLDCSDKNSGCNGGYLDEAWWFVRDHGVAADECVPYEAAQHNQCPSQCVDHAMPLLPLAHTIDAFSPFVAFEAAQTVALIQQEILSHGPMAAAFFVLDDFSSYAGGVYQHVKGAQLRGGHAIKIIGWGVSSDAGVPYWLCANSWGSDWGEGGFFKIVRGINECGIETQVTAGIPRL